MNLPPLTACPDQFPDDFELSAGRQCELPPPNEVITGLYPVGVTLICGKPKSGKSTLALVPELRLALGFGGEPAGRVWVQDYEGNPRLMITASLRIVRRGGLVTDGQYRDLTDLDGPFRVSTKPPGDTFEERFEYLKDTLEDARARGIPFRLVRIDTMGRFIGKPDQDEDAYAHTSRTLGKLNRLALEYGIAIVIIHHPNKKGEVSGSVGIEGAVTAIYWLVPHKDQGEGLLDCTGNREAEPKSWALLWNAVYGVWMFAEDLTLVQVVNKGQRREVVDFLTKNGRATAAEITAGLSIPRDSVKTALQRLHADGQVHYDRETRWGLVDPATGEVPVPAVPEPAPRTVALCEVCGERMDVLEDGQTHHPTCEPEPEPEQPAEGFNAYATMDGVLRSSKLHPLWFIPEADRDAGAWPEAVRASLTAQHGHRWKRPDLEAFAGRVVLSLDRHQSYPGSCNGVAVAPGPLKHYGGVDLGNPKDEKLAGICEVVVPDWDEALIGHPLGRDAVIGQRLWVPSGQVEQLWKLHEAGQIARPYVTDSWLGRRTTSLFDDFQVAVRDARAAASTPEETSAVKLHSSVVIRKLHPRGSKSQWWRPDWHAAICAEAATRLWVVAWRAVQAGCDLAEMGNTDAVSWFMPEGETEKWAPPGYLLGDGPGTYHVVTP